MTEPNPEEPTLTLTDFLQEQNQLELDAARAYPGAHTSCSWPGILFQIIKYIIDTRNQHLYMCSTCPDPLVFCASCAVKCHPIEHDLLDLYDKRGYKCDCGTFGTAHSCSFIRSKSEVVNDNIYSCNILKGTYCFCAGAYNMELDNMYQCINCQVYCHQGVF